MEVIAVLTLLGLIGLVVLLIVSIAQYFLRINLLSSIYYSLSRYSLWFAYIVALMATLGSLYFSEIRGFEPCRLCWWQRIFMYPQVFILPIAAFKKDVGVTRYVLPLLLLGGSIAVLQVYIQAFPDSSLACSVGQVSCSEGYVSYFGFISIPIMALVSFIYTGVFVLLANIPMPSNQSNIV